MREYIARAGVTLGAGRIRIDADQEKTRAHNLKPLGEGLHEIVNPIQFKRGERFGWDGEVPKALAAAFEEVGGGAAKMEAAAGEVRKAVGKVKDAAKKLF